MIVQLQTSLSFLSKNYEDIKNRDSTTGLRNKEHFYTLLKREIERMARYGGKLSLATADIDNFTLVNEEFGYEFSNMILRTISNIFSTGFRIFDITGRFAEDEICVLLINTNEKEAFSSLERCRKMVEENKFYYENKEITITNSVGISSIKRKKKKDGASYYEEKKEMIFRNLIFDSINALSKAKRSGKNMTITQSDLFSS
jgi:diguanylate cyclase (GGDEF)-like protein